MPLRTPPFIFYDKRDGAAVHSETLSKRSKLTPLACKGRTNFVNLRPCQPGCSAAFSTVRLTVREVVISLFNHVAHILSVSLRLQMRRVAAERIRLHWAFVANLKALWNCTVSQNPRCPVCFDQSIPFRSLVYHAIPITILCGQPRPALPGLAHVNFDPKALWKVEIQSLRNEELRSNFDHRVVSCRAALLAHPAFLFCGRHHPKARQNS